jgi:hypothetical protein
MWYASHTHFADFWQKITELFVLSVLYYFSLFEITKRSLKFIPYKKGHAAVNFVVQRN